MTNDMTQRPETGLSAEQEMKDLLAQGQKQSGRVPLPRFIIPTVKLNNSHKFRKENGVEIGSLYLTRMNKDQDVVIEEIGTEIKGVILKERFAISSRFDPDGKTIPFYSREFDSFQDNIEVIDSDSKEVYFRGSYQEFQAGHQVTDKRGTRNDYVTKVNLYILVDGKVSEPVVYRLTFKGKSMSEYFAYLNGDNKRGIEPISKKGVMLFNYVHRFSVMEGEKPNGEPYWYMTFAPHRELEMDELKAVVKELQPKLNEQLLALQKKYQPAGQANVAAPAGAAPKVAEDDMPTINLDEEDDIKIEDVPF